MKLQYDKKTNAVYLELAKGTYEVSRKVTDEILVDEDKNGKILGIEILNATNNIKEFDPKKITLSI